MSERLNRLLGDTPFRIAIRLLVLSFVVGLALSTLGIHPLDVYAWVERLVLRIYDSGFAFLADALAYVLYGGLIVVPAFVILRLLRLGRRRRAE
jgi:hypothetical protein